MRGLKAGGVFLCTVVAVVGSIPGPAAAASTNVVTAIKTQDGVIRRLPANKDLNAHFGSITLTQAKKLEPEIGPLVKATDRAISVVAHATTSSSRQRQGQLEWVKASREQVRGILEYRAALQALLAGKHGAFKTEHAKALKLIGDSVLLSARGDRLLGISINY